MEYKVWRGRVVLHWSFPDRQPHRGWDLSAEQAAVGAPLQLQAPLLEGTLGQTGKGGR